MLADYVLQPCKTTVHKFGLFHTDRSHVLCGYIYIYIEIYVHILYIYICPCIGCPGSIKDQPHAGGSVTARPKAKRQFSGLGSCFGALYK